MAKKTPKPETTERSDEECQVLYDKAMAVALKLTAWVIDQNATTEGGVPPQVMLIALGKVIIGIFEACDEEYRSEQIAVWLIAFLNDLAKKTGGGVIAIDRMNLPGVKTKTQKKAEPIH